MNEAGEEILRRLDASGIPYDIARHPAAYTMADCLLPETMLRCVVPKNLVLTPRNRSAFYLCIVSPGTPFRTADISRQIPASRLSFATEEDMTELLRTYPGAASPLGLLFDENARVRFLMDAALQKLPRLGFHPNDNEYTVAMATEDFLRRFLPLTRHTAQTVVPGQKEDFTHA